MLIVAQFLACTFVIVVTGARLSRYGDIIAEKTGLGTTWVGVVLMASVTSLPELITGGSSVLLFGLPDIAVGDAVGSCLFNLLILAALDVRFPMLLSTRIHQGHVLSASFGIVLLSLAVLALEAGVRVPRIGWVGFSSLALIVGYLLAMRTIYFYEKKRVAQLAREMAHELRHEKTTLSRALTLYGLNGFVLVVTAAWLPHIGEQLAVLTGLGQTFVGNIMIAFSTSLPEVVVSIAAARMGSMDLAAGNLLGSNIFNMAILGFDDVLYGQGVLLAAADPRHIVAAVGAIAMTATAILGMTYSVARKKYRWPWDGIVMIGIYGLTVLMLLALP